MSEASVVSVSSKPLTQALLTTQLREAGLERGMDVIVHVALSQLGWVCGGPEALLRALMNVLGEGGTLVMATPSSQCSDPVHWQKPAVPSSWWPTIRETMPAFLPELTPTRGVGVVPEMFRAMPGVQRSAHPTCSFSAWGNKASEMIEGHTLDHPFGESSALARLYEVDGHVLLLGVGHSVNTSLHLAQERSGRFPFRIQGSSVVLEGKRTWAEYQELDADTDEFETIGARFEAERLVTRKQVGNAPATLLQQQQLVDFAVSHFQNR